MVFGNRDYRREIIKYQLALEEKDRAIEYYKNQLILADRKLDEKIDESGYVTNDFVRKLYELINDYAKELEEYKNKYKDECQKRLELLEMMSNNKDVIQ